MGRGVAAALAALSCVATLSACGGGEAEPERRAEPPKIPGALAEELAARGDAVAEKLEAGDVCAAAHEADALEDRVEQLIAEGEIPDRYQEELQSEAIWLRDNVNCPQPPPPEEEEKPPPEGEEKEEEEKKEEEEDKKEGEDGKGDDDGGGPVDTVVTVEGIG